MVSGQSHFFLRRGHITQPEMYLKFSCVLGLFFVWDKLCSAASKRSQSLGRLFTWGAPRDAQSLQKWYRCLCQHFSCTPLQSCRKRLQKASTSGTLLNTSAALTHKPGYENKCLYTRHSFTAWSNSCCLWCRSWQSSRDSAVLALE